MTCYHPIKAFIINDISDKHLNERHFIFADSDKEYVIYHHQKITDYLLLPCRKCIGCQMDRSRDWATRMMLELNYHDKACFITLTYDDDHVPVSPIECDENGTIIEGKMTLRKKDLQDFMKRLRKHYEPEKIRFFGCGEYGSRTFRPHYHVVLFGVDFSEDRYIWKNRDGYIDYRSHTLEKIWTEGNSLINVVNWNTCAYVARYVTKKVDSHKIHYQTFGIEPEFQTMSRKPGLGYKFFEEHAREIYGEYLDGEIEQPGIKDPKVYMKTNKGAMSIRASPYFDRKMAEIDPDLMDVINERRRKVGTLNYENLLRGTDKKLGEVLRDQEKYFKSRIKSLKREKV